MSNIPNYHMVWNNIRAAFTIRYQRRRSILVWLKFIDTILDMKVKIYHQTAISPRDQFLINCSMLLDDLRTIMQCGLSPYFIIHLHIRLRGRMPNYLDMTTEFDRYVSTYDNGLPYSNSVPILINSDTRSYSGLVLSSIPWNISRSADPVQDISDIYDYRGMHVSTSPPRSALSYYVETPGPNNEYISLHRVNEYSINSRINLMTHLPNRSSVVLNVKLGDKIFDLKIEIFEKTSIQASDQYLVALSKVLDDRFTLKDSGISEHSYIRLRKEVQQPGSNRQREDQDEPPRPNTRSRLNPPHSSLGSQ